MPLPRASAVVLASLCATSSLLFAPLPRAAAATCTTGSLDGLSAAEITARITECIPSAKDPGAVATVVETAETGFTIEEVGGEMALVAETPAGDVLGAGAGAFLGTCEALKALPWWNNHSCSAGASRVLGWIFGTNGDDRSWSAAIPGSPWGWQSGSPPPLAEQYGSTSFAVATAGGDSTHYHVDVDDECRTDASGNVRTIHEKVDFETWIGMGESISPCSGGEGLVRWVMYATGTLTRYADWHVDLPQPWTITPRVHCDDGTTVDGAPVTISAPAAGDAVALNIPDCVTGNPVSGEAVGARSGETTTTIVLPVQKVDSTTTTTTDNGDGTSTGSTTTTTTTIEDTNGADPGGEGRSCIGGIVSWNPLDWVYVPVKCALTWAFVPSDTDVESVLQPLHDEFEGTIGVLFTSFDDLINAFVPSHGTADSSGNCLGPSISVGVLHLEDIHPLDACDEPMKTVAGYVHALLTLGVWVGLAMVLVKTGGGVFGVKVPMGGGDDTP